MDLDDIKDLKNKATEILDETLKKRAIVPFEGSNSNPIKYRIPPALGIHPKDKQDYQLAIRLASESDIELVQQILNNISIENIDIQITGKIIPLSHFLSIGTAIAHRKRWIKKAAYGTLGCFVQKRGCSSEELLILSNNHVLTNLTGDIDNEAIVTCNKGKVKDWLTRKIFSKIPHSLPYSKVGEIATLKESICLKYGDNINLVDAAIATVNEPHRIKINEIEGLCSLQGFRDKNAFIKRDDLGKLVLTKIGARTGLTSGRITTFEQKQTVYFPNGACIFIEVFEIKQIEGEKPFALPGDSGAIVFDQEGYAVALIFSGSEFQDGTAYAIPISTVLETLEIEIVPLKKFQLV